MDNQIWGIVIFFAIVNGAAFFVMFLDKLQARKKNAERISEGMLFFLATVFGSIGVFAGMLAFRHKTQKWYFITGIPLLILENCAFLYLVHAYMIGEV